ncbi:ATP-binding protein [Streptomyces sp. NPDC051956]|uniref:sensor histidine kinase n=1 Tax=Streptomyces sp. NPDC051956 TaxID=3365677 RepID=UPI0037D252B0
MLRETNERNISVVRALLDLASADHAPFDPDPVDLAELAERAATEHSAQAAARGIRLDVDTESGCETCEVAGNTTLLRQLFLNLLDNALVHNVSWNGDVHLSVFRDRDAAVVMEVENTGPHVDKAVVDQLFEPFYRGRSRVSSDRSGHGLGLAIVRSIASAHHGTATASASRYVSNFQCPHSHGDDPDQQGGPHSVSCRPGAWPEGVRAATTTISLGRHPLTAHGQVLLMARSAERDRAGQRSTRPSDAERSVTPAETSPSTGHVRHPRPDCRSPRHPRQTHPASRCRPGRHHVRGPACGYFEGRDVKAAEQVTVACEAPGPRPPRVHPAGGGQSRKKRRMSGKAAGWM